MLAVVGLLSVAIGSLAVEQSDVSRTAFVLIACVFPALLALLAIESKRATRAFAIGALLPAVVVAIVALSRIGLSLATGGAVLPGPRPSRSLLLHHAVFLAAWDGRPVAMIVWPLALACGVACAVIYWVVVPREGQNANRIR